MKNLYLLLIAFSFSVMSFGQTVIAVQDFDTPPGAPTMTYGTNGQGSVYTGGISVSPNNSFLAQNDNAILTFGAVNTVGYTSVGLEFRLGSYNTGSGGADNGDTVLAQISPNNGTTWYSQVLVRGNNNATWSYAAGTGIASKAYAANNTSATFAPAGGGPRTNDGYSTVRVTGLPNVTQLRVRLTLLNDANTEAWLIDDVKITGTPNCSSPSSQATLYNTTNINAPFGGNATLNWTRGGGDNVLVVMREGSAVNSDPVSGTAYAGNTAFGNGTEIGTGNFVVYNGPASNVNVTNLGLNTTYHVAIYEYNNTSTCYNTIELTGNFFIPCGGALGVPFNEGFENGGAIPNCWTVETTAPITNWIYAAGDANPATNSLDIAHTGSYNARLYKTNTTPSVTKLVTPALNLTNLANPTLTFWHAQALWAPDQDELRVYYKTSIGGAWTLIPGQTYTNDITTWTQRTVILPNPSATYYVAFEGTAKYGRGVVLDDVSVTGTVIYTYDNAWIPSSPIGVSTSANTIVIANGIAVISANTQSNTITVNPTAAVTVNPGVTLSSANGLTLQSNTTRYSSLVLDGTITGTVNYNRHVNGGTGVTGAVGSNDLISAPVTGQTFASFVAANPLNIKSDPNNANRKLFGPFNKATGTYDLWTNTVQAQANNTLTAGVGYRAASTDNGGFTFTGTPNKGTIAINIVNSAGVQFAAYNLIGNPYPSYINVRGFLEYDVEPGAAVVRNIDLMDSYGAIYGYDGNTAGANNSGWVVYNLTTATSINMTPGQGFLVTADAADVAAYDMTFAPSMRRIGTTDDFIPNRVADENNVHVKLQASIGTDMFTTDIFFNDNTTSGLDFGYDAGMFGANAPTKAIYSQLVDNNTGVDMAIQALAFTALGTDISVPLGINALQGEQVTVSIAESDLPSDIEVYLEDNVTGTFTLLNTSDYVFTPSATLNDTGRFFLRFADQTLATPDNSMSGLQIYATASPRALLVKGLLTATTSVQVYDIQGRLVLSSQLEASSTNNQVDVSSLNTGVYVVKLNNSTQQKTQKVILK